MANTHSLLLYHFVFSTKHRQPTLMPEARQRVFPYIAGIVSRLGGKALIINGVDDHLHMLCHLLPRHCVADVLKTVKGSSSAWFNQQCRMGSLRWQDGYGAFSVSLSGKDAVYTYIAKQEEHHRLRTFPEEYEALLRLHGIEYDASHHLD